MKREEYLAAIELVSADPPDRRKQFYGLLAGGRVALRLSAFEQAISDNLIEQALASVPTWYHGGIARRVVGDLLPPSSATGADPQKKGSGQFPMDRVFVAHRRQVAAGFAQRNEKAAVESRL